MQYHSCGRFAQNVWHSNKESPGTDLEETLRRKTKSNGAQQFRSWNRKRTLWRSWWQYCAKVDLLSTTVLHHKNLFLRLFSTCKFKIKSLKFKNERKWLSKLWSSHKTDLIGRNFDAKARGGYVATCTIKCNSRERRQYAKGDYIRQQDYRLSLHFLLLFTISMHYFW